MTAAAAAGTADGSAIALDRQAGVVAELLDAVAAASGADTWRGPAADAFAASLEQQRRMLRIIADDLRSAARQMLVAAATGSTVAAGR